MRMTAWDARFRETDAEGNKKTYTYDALGRTKTETDGAGNKTTYTYDPVGNLLVTTDANGNETKTEYNASMQQ